MTKKYELIESDKNNLYRIKALKDFGYVKAGDIGGYVSGEHNLSQDEDCWIYDNAQVYGNAQVFGNSVVFGSARVYDNAQVYGNAQVFGNSVVSGNAQVFDNARVFGNAQVYGKAQVFGNAQVYGKARVYDNAKVSDICWIYGKALVYGKAKVFDYSEVCDNAVVCGNAEVCDKAKVFGKARVIGDAEVSDNAKPEEGNNTTKQIQLPRSGEYEDIQPVLISKSGIRLFGQDITSDPDVCKFIMEAIYRRKPFYHLLFDVSSNGSGKIGPFKIGPTSLEIDSDEYPNYTTNCPVEAFNFILFWAVKENA